MVAYQLYAGIVQRLGRYPSKLDTPVRVRFPAPFMRRKVWVTYSRAWRGTEFLKGVTSEIEESPEISCPVELEGCVSPGSGDFICFSEIWYQCSDSPKRFLWLKKRMDWHETEEEAKLYLEWMKKYIPPPPLPPDPNWLEKTRKTHQERRNIKFREEQKQTIEFALEHAKIPASRILSEPTQRH